jgi:hypothetical protein
MWLGAHAHQRIDKLILSNTATNLEQPQAYADTVLGFLKQR